MERRTFLIGGLAGLSALALSACTPSSPTPAIPTTNSSTPTPEPEQGLPQPIAVVRSSWATDPFALGSQSYLAVGASPADRLALAAPINDRIFMAGEATSVDRAGTVAGAWLSGIRSASEIADIAAPGERIAILGAGIAGAAAARQLSAAGFDVVVMEARDRLGGRIDTVSGDHWAFPVERGAFLLEDVAGNVLVGELGSQGISTELLDPVDETRDSSGDVVVAPAGRDRVLASAVEWAQGISADVSLDAAIAAVGFSELVTETETPTVTDAEWMDLYIAATVEPASGATAEELSARFGWSPSADSSRRIVTGGFQNVVGGVLDGIDVRLSSAVVGVLQADDAVSLRFATGESFNADRVIVTLPLGVLKTDGIVFDPELPTTHRDAIEALGMGNLEQVVLRFDKAFWQTEASLWSVVGTESPFASWINLQPSTGEPVLVGMVPAENVAAFNELSDEKVIEQALASLESFLAG
ncbi:MAG: oxidoreductase [Glaciihabitans sp.]|nr:oxidoreductase [Glaciihabitans sp.]